MQTENSERHAALVDAIGVANGQPPAAAPEATKNPLDPAQPEQDPNAQANAEAPEGEEDEDESATSDGTESPDAANPRPRRNRLQERFDKLTGERYAEKLAREAAEARVAQLEQQLTADVPADRPTLEQHGYDADAYEAALVKWARADAARVARTELQQQESARRAQEEGTKFQQRIEALEKEIPGAWEAAISAPINYPRPMFEAIKESEIGPRIGYHLSQHLDEAHRIAALPPVQQVSAIVRLEAQLTAAKAPAAAPAPPAPRVSQKTVSNAPPPPPALQSSARVATPLAEQSIEDRMKAIREFEARR